MCPDIGDFQVDGVFIERKSQLEELHESGCERIEGDLRVYFIPGVEDLSLLENITHVKSGIEIGYTDDLKSLDGLENLRDYPLLSLIQNASLVDTTALPAPEAARDDRGFYLFVSFNESLRSLGGLSEMRLPIWVSIVGNASLEEIPALRDAYTDVDEEVRVRFRAERNPKLPQCLVDEILSRLPEEYYISVTGGNDESATCE